MDAQPKTLTVIDSIVQLVISLNLVQFVIGVDHKGHPAKNEGWTIRDAQPKTWTAIDSIVQLVI